MAGLVVIVALFVLLDVVAVLFAADTSDGDDWRRHRGLA
jgi:hypothetical protein